MSPKYISHMCQKNSGNEETQKQGILKILKIDKKCQKTKIQLKNSFSFFPVYNSFFSFILQTKLLLIFTVFALPLGK